MNTILLIHCPNLNMLGARDAAHYGTLTLKALEEKVRHEAECHGYSVLAFQSNHEGALIDWLQEKSPTAMGIIINPGALTHYSYALHDALVDANVPTVEVHLSDIHHREAWRSVSVIQGACCTQISGKQEQGYLEAVNYLVTYIKHNPSPKL